jgi:hypothetical protein
MGPLFSSKPKPQGVTQAEIDQHIHELKVLRDRFTRYRRQQESLRETELNRARQCAREGKQDRARLLLRQKKLREKYIEQAEKLIENLETEINQITTAQMNVDYIRGMDATNQILKKMNELMPVEQVEAILDENRDQSERINEISRLVQEDLDPEAQQAAQDDYDQMLADLGVGGEAYEAPQEEDERPQRVALLA